MHFLFPYRRGRHIKYDDDMEDAEEMLDWLTAPENMILNDQVIFIAETLYKLIVNKPESRFINTFLKN